MKTQSTIPTLTRFRKHLNADALYSRIFIALKKIPEHRRGKCDILLVDALMSAFAMFVLKDPSMLRFDERRLNEAEAANLKTIFGITIIPADTTMREIIDPVKPESFRPAYKAVFRSLQRGKALEQLTFLDGYYLLALDGTETHSSHHIGSENSQKKVNKETGLITYYQQMVGAAIVCPGQPIVVPLMPEMIRPQDGKTKNDCERSAVRRWPAGFRKDHPHLKVIVVEDALSSNGPHIRDLKEHNCRFILGVKQGDHEFLYKH
ncbi:MAG: hypothetical protein ABXS91_11215, partial [Sulfurimonas sp.]